MPSFSLQRWAIRQLGGVPAESFHRNQHELEEAQQALQTARSESAALARKVSDLDAALESANAKQQKTDKALELAKWTHPYRVEFLAERVSFFGDLVRNTVNVWDQFGKGQGVGIPRNFEGGMNPAGLYWALTHASLCGSKALSALDNEDAMTSDFVDELEKQLGRATQLLGSSIEVHAGEISKKLRPALKEVSVGADLLLLVSGDGLVPRAGVRLLWLQFKQTTNRSKSLELDVYRKPNAAGGTQLDALRGVHRPDLGSFGIYALASDQYDFFASSSVEKLGHIDPKVRTDCTIDLAKAGIRLQELILLHSTTPTQGQFETGDEVVQFVDVLASGAAIIPLTVLSVTSGEEQIQARQLVRRIKETWDRRLKDHIKSLPEARREQLGLDDDDRYPSPGR